VTATVIRGAGAPAPSLTNPVSTPELVWASTAGAIAKSAATTNIRKRPQNGREGDDG
jgi:hypothetical protein